MIDAGIENNSLTPFEDKDAFVAFLDDSSQSIVDMYLKKNLYTTDVDASTLSLEDRYLYGHRVALFRAEDHAWYVLDPLRA